MRKLKIKLKTWLGIFEVAQGMAAMEALIVHSLMDRIVKMDAEIASLRKRLPTIEPTCPTNMSSGFVRGWSAAKHGLHNGETLAELKRRDLGRCDYTNGWHARLDIENT